jgi:hypothetical protein
MKVKSREQLERERLVLMRRPIKKLTHKQLAECLIECSRAYGWSLVRRMLTWFREKRKDSLGGLTRTVSVDKQRNKIAYEKKELKEYYMTKQDGDTESRMELLMQVPYDALRWVARNIGKAHCEDRYKSVQFKFGVGAWGKVSENPNPEDDIPPCTIGSPRNKRKVRELVKPTKRQLKSWLKESKKRQQAKMKNRSVRKVVRHKIELVNKPVKWIEHLRKVNEFVERTRGAMNQVTEEATKRLAKERKSRSFGTMPTTSTNKETAIVRAN